MYTNIKLRSAGMPKIDKATTVIIFIGIIRFSGPTNKLYPYSKKELKTILLIIFRIIFNI